MGFGCCDASMLFDFQEFTALVSVKVNISECSEKYVFPSHSYNLDADVNGVKEAQIRK